MAAKPKKRGRPKKPESERLSRNSIYLRCDDETASAVEAYRRKYDVVSAADAVRRIVKQFLRGEGLL